MAAFLLAGTLDEDRAEKVAFEILIKYKDMTAADYGIPNGDMPPIGPISNELRQNNEHSLSAKRACDYSMKALAILRSKRAIPLMKKFQGRNNGWFFICHDYSASQELGKFHRRRCDEKDIVG